MILGKQQIPGITKSNTNKDQCQSLFIIQTFILLECCRDVQREATSKRITQTFFNLNWWSCERPNLSASKTIKELTGFDSEITTDSNGEYEFTGIPAGDYVVRFIYGDDNTLVPESPLKNGNIKYSGQDYKSTTYQVGTIAGVDNDANPELDGTRIDNTTCNI